MAPYLLCFLLSLTPQQLTFLWKCQPPSLADAPLYFPLDFKSSLSPGQLSLYARSHIWKLPRDRFLRPSGSTGTLADLIQPETLPTYSGTPTYRQLTLRDQRFLGFLQATPDFLTHLDDLQKRVLSNAVRYDVLLRYFWVCVTPEQIRDLETRIVERGVEDAVQEEMLREIAWGA